MADRHHAVHETLAILAVLRSPQAEARKGRPASLKGDVGLPEGRKAGARLAGLAGLVVLAQGEALRDQLRWPTRGKIERGRVGRGLE